MIEISVDVCFDFIDVFCLVICQSANVRIGTTSVELLRVIILQILFEAREKDYNIK